MIISVSSMIIIIIFIIIIDIVERKLELLTQQKAVQTEACAVKRGGPQRTTPERTRNAALYDKEFSSGGVFLFTDNALSAAVHSAPLWKEHAALYA